MNKSPRWYQNDLWSNFGNFLCVLPNKSFWLSLTLKTLEKEKDLSDWLYKIPIKIFDIQEIFLKNRYFIFWVLIGIFHENKYLAMNQVFYYILTYIFHISKLRMFIEDDTTTGHKTERIYRRSCQSVFIWTLPLWNFTLLFLDESNQYKMIDTHC